MEHGFKNRILVTGGAGFIGSTLVDKLIENPDNFVLVVDNLSTGNIKRLPTENKYKNWRFIKCDVNSYRDIAAILTSYQLDYVFHYAAVVGVKRTLENPVAVLNDINGFKYILDLCKNTGVKRIFFSSSSEVYGEPFEHPQNEMTTPLNSRLPYAVVKNVGEAFLKSYKQEFNLDYTIFRFFNTYGPKQSSDFVMTRFIKAALENKEITIYGDGSQTRTFCYRDDNVEACVRCLYEDLHINDTVNIGSDHEISILDLAKLIIKITNSKSEIVHLPPLKEGDMTRRRPDITKMKKLLGRPMTTLEEGIRKTIESGQYNY
ncbi:MAG: NAD-dependent epimerase/dehydratase family protein [Chitinophagales bacterium]|nr:NAD-dependent epimerase/dehydratase family protein [Chitinophagales bacterium]MDW8418260.1 NAD-dependent epimerase/dehydratase family protein [Chitinophagales bacterium]